VRATGFCRAPNLGCVLRTALRPRWLGLLAVALLFVVAFVQLGRWQLGVAEDKALKEQLEAAKKVGVVELSTVLQPHSPFPGELSGRPVRATGTYAADEQVLVTDRRLDGQTGWWVVTALHTDAGPTLPVLRGFVTSPDAVPAPPAGPVTVRGGLAPAESPLSSAGLPQGQLRSVDLSVLVNQWSGDLYNAFVFLEEQKPASDLTTVPTPTPTPGINWRNASYAAQWWVFALFALWLWWRMVRDAHRQDHPAPAAGEGDPAPRHTDDA
jgi:surfeit locus 1 family protein